MTNEPNHLMTVDALWHRIKVYRELKSSIEKRSVEYLDACDEIQAAIDEAIAETARVAVDEAIDALIASVKSDVFAKVAARVRDEILSQQGIRVR